MSNSLTKRELIVAAFLPAILISGIYVFAFERPTRSEINQREGQIAVAKQTAIPPARLQSAENEVRRLTEELDREHRLEEATTRPSLIAPAIWTSAEGRVNAVAYVSEIFEKHGLSINASIQVADTEARGAPPKTLQELAAAIAHEGRLPSPEVWKVEVIGTFANFFAAMKEISTFDGFIIPLQFAMEPLGDDVKERKWTLWIWV